jgi:hypothetical protein
MKTDRLPGSQITKGQDFRLHIVRGDHEYAPVEVVDVRVKEIKGTMATVEGPTFHGRFDLNTLGMLGTKK